jgi:hypothetical protein
MAYGVIIPKLIAASNVDAWVRSAYCATAVENGNIMALLTKSAVADESEVWVATQPAAAGSHLTDLWMAYEPELVRTGNYRGLDPDVRNFLVPATSGSSRYVFTAFLPQLHDILLMSSDCFTGAKGGAGNTHGNATNGQWKFVWGASQTASVLSVKYLSTDYISIATGAIDEQRLLAYTMEVVGL